MCFSWLSCWCKGYKLLDLQTKQIFISRGVFFHENIFPFHSIQEFASTADPFPNLVLPSMSLDNLTPPYSTQPDPIILDPTPIAPTPPNPITRKSSRPVKRPSYLKDFHCNLLQSSPILPSTSTSYPLTNYLSYHHLLLLIGILFWLSLLMRNQNFIIKQPNLLIGVQICKMSLQPWSLITLDQ